MLMWFEFLITSRIYCWCISTAKSNIFGFCVAIQWDDINLEWFGLYLWQPYFSHLQEKIRFILLFSNNQFFLNQFFLISLILWGFLNVYEFRLGFCSFFEQFWGGKNMLFFSLRFAVYLIIYLIMSIFDDKIF